MSFLGGFLKKLLYRYIIIHSCFSFYTTGTMGSFEDEDRKYQEEVNDVKAWWQDSRWRYTKRPFTAEQIVAKRGTLTIDYPSNVQAKKLWGILEHNFKVRRPRRLKSK